MLMKLWDELPVSRKADSNRGTHGDGSLTMYGLPYLDEKPQLMKGGAVCHRI